MRAVKISCQNSKISVKVLSMNPSVLDLIATAIFVSALVHTFSVKFFLKLAHAAPSGSVKENLFHLLGEVEVVFGL